MSNFYLYTYKGYFVLRNYHLRPHQLPQLDCLNTLFQVVSDFGLWGKSSLCHLFTLYWNKEALFLYTLFMAAFAQQNWAIAQRPKDPQSLKYWLSGPSQKTFANHHTLFSENTDSFLFLHQRFCVVRWKRNQNNFIWWWEIQIILQRMSFGVSEIWVQILGLTFSIWSLWYSVSLPWNFSILFLWGKKVIC